jgi:muramoyltetrapeptide carboxypeptidase
MSHIYIYSPSTAVRDKAAFRRGVRHLRTQGHEVEIDPNALSSAMRFAGDDEMRLAAIHRAAASGADVAMIARGGYGLTRILPAIQYKSVAKAIERGTQFVGFSDFTALQLGLLSKTGAMSWAGPSVCDDFGAQVEDDGSPDVVMQACFDDFLLGQGEGAGWRVASERGAPVAADLEVHKALLWGGNLAVLVSLLGTPYFPEVKGGILFLEDVGEHPYRLERMLTQLLHAGVLARQKALVLGQFTGYKAAPNDKGFKFETVVQWLRSHLKISVLTNLPMGHVPTKVLLPVGRKVTLTLQQRDAFLLWEHGH